MDSAIIIVCSNTCLLDSDLSGGKRYQHMNHWDQNWEYHWCLDVSPKMGCTGVDQRYNLILGTNSEALGLVLQTHPKPAKKIIASTPLTCTLQTIAEVSSWCH